MAKCTNCLLDYEGVYLVLKNENYYACPNCSVTYGKDRTGYAFILEQEVYVNKYHSMTNGRIFIVKGIFIHEECESGRMIYLVDKETGRPLNRMLDVNWLKSVTN